MIKRSKQNWEVGQTVNVGFVRNLTVVDKIATPGDFKPDQYRLKSEKGVLYIFTPHNGLERESA